MSVTAIGYDWGATPPTVRMTVTDNLATLTTAGYWLGTAIQAEIEALNNGAFDVADGTVFLIDYSDGEGFFSLDTVAGTFSAETSDVVLPTIANYIAHFTGADGTISSAAANVINNGDIQAGIDASDGKFVSYPATTASGTLEVVAVDSSADVAVTISNADHAQASVYSIPDGGQATAEFIISDSAGTQHITTGGLQVDAGIVSSGLAAGGSVGRFDAYSTTAANGILSLAAVDAGGDFDTTISNAASVGQDQVITIPDSGGATANFAVAPAALVDGNVVTASGTDGLIQDGGFAVLANTTAAYGGGGTSNAFTATGIGATSIVTASILASTNAVSIVKVVPTANTLTVDFSADPGAATTVSWISITPAV